jgi:hypothetical protein
MNPSEEAVSGLAPVNGAELYCEAKGAGAPILFLHAGVADAHGGRVRPRHRGVLRRRRCDRPRPGVSAEGSVAGARSEEEALARGDPEAADAVEKELSPPCPVPSVLIFLQPAQMGRIPSRETTMGLNASEKSPMSLQGNPEWV